MGRYRRYYETLNVAELRRRQNITAQQITYASHHNKTRALIRLQRIYDLLSATIMGKEFPAG